MNLKEFEKDETILLERVVLTGGPTVSRELEGCEGLRARKQTHQQIPPAASNNSLLTL